MHIILVGETSPMMDGRPALELRKAVSAFVSQLQDNAAAADSFFLTTIGYSSAKIGVPEGSRKPLLQLSKAGPWFTSSPRDSAESRIEGWPDFAAAVQCVKNLLRPEPTVVVFIVNLRSATDASDLVASFDEHGGKTSAIQLFVDSPDAAAPPLLPSQAAHALAEFSRGIAAGKSLDEACRNQNITPQDIATWRLGQQRREHEVLRQANEKTFGIPLIPRAYQLVLRGIMFREFFDWLATQLTAVPGRSGELNEFDTSVARNFLRHASRVSELL